MPIKVKHELLIIDILTILLIIIITFFPLDILRIILGLPFLLFFPGYTLIAALFTRRQRMSGIERVVLSFGMSIVVVPFIGFILNYTPWGVKLEPVLYSVAAFIFITSVIAWFRRRRLTPEERFSIEFRLSLPGWGGSIWGKGLSIILVITIVGALGMLGYVITKPKVGERFTEFYVLGPEGKAVDYLSGLKVGEEGRIIVGIVNHEKAKVSYRVEVRIDGVVNNELKPIMLGDEQKWEEMVGFTPDRAGDNQEVEFLLYKNGESEPCLKPLRLWVNVEEPK